uniref:Uncharacterized protein n=1 Tax=Gasterosteus aculeatus aculeatus TaxID=481459 RepID=A0AAQ4NNN9_GASAC
MKCVFWSIINAFRWSLLPTPGGAAGSRERENVAAAINCDESVRFSQVTAVANRWIFDFWFVSLCRRFKDGQFDEFNETGRQLAQASLKHLSASYRCQRPVFKRVMLLSDVQFEEEADVMPLMSAAKMWPDLKSTVKDKSLSKNITQLLVVQVIASTHFWGTRPDFKLYFLRIIYFNIIIFQQNLIVKLTTIVTRRETYHPFLMSFSFSRLLETIKSYLDAYLEKNPSDYLLKVQDRSQCAGKPFEFNYPARQMYRAAFDKGPNPHLSVAPKIIAN